MQPNREVRLIRVIVILIGTTTSQLFACTNLLVTRGASESNSVSICYICNAPFASQLIWRPGGDHLAGTHVETGTSLDRARVKQVPHTYAVLATNYSLAHMNEHQLAIGESSFGGRPDLNNRGGLNFLHLMILALQRCKTARGAIQCIATLANEHGYRGRGETFSIGDTKEAWIMEFIGKGRDRKGIVWVAVRIPDGHISCHANQSRIREFPLDDSENCIYSEDVISFAIEQGFYDPASDGPFNFSDAYNPASKGIRKRCSMRVWSLLRRAAPSLNLSSDYHRSVEGARRYPLSIKPDKLLSVKDIFALLRDHYEDTEFDMTKGDKAGEHFSPYYRGGERAISGRGTVFSIVTQSRGDFPDPIGGIVWYSPDDTFFACYSPLYCGTQAVPQSYTIADRDRFSFDSAWWTFNFVANYAYPRYSQVIGDIQKLQEEIEDSLILRQPEIEQQALDLYMENPQLATEHLTQYTVESGENVVKRWRELAFHLITKYSNK